MIGGVARGLVRAFRSLAGADLRAEEREREQRAHDEEQRQIGARVWAEVEARRAEKESQEQRVRKGANVEIAERYAGAPVVEHGDVTDAVRELAKGFAYHHTAAHVRGLGDIITQVHLYPKGALICFASGYGKMLAYVTKEDMAGYKDLPTHPWASGWAPQIVPTTVYQSMLLN